MACSKPIVDNTAGIIVVDIQGDFTTLKNGSLAVPDSGRDFVEKVRTSSETLFKNGFKLFATQDWHPPDHMSFYTNNKGKKPFDTIQVNGLTQILWPPHCIQGSENAWILLDTSLFTGIIKKGKDPDHDSYSGFKDDGGTKTGMDDILEKHLIEKVIVYGIATDYCVKFTAMDAIRAGYKVTVIESLCRGVAQDTSLKALEEMKDAGVKVLEEIDLVKINTG